MADDLFAVEGLVMRMAVKEVLPYCLGFKVVRMLAVTLFLPVSHITVFFRGGEVLLFPLLLQLFPSWEGAVMVFQRMEREHCVWHSRLHFCRRAHPQATHQEFLQAEAVLSPGIIVLGLGLLTVDSKIVVDPGMAHVF